MKAMGLWSEESPGHDPGILERSAASLEHGVEALDELTSTIGASLLLINRDLTIAWANRVAREHYGSPERLLGRRCFEAIRGLEAVCPDCPWNGAAAEAARSTVQVRATRDGRKAQWEVGVVPIRDRSGAVSQFLEFGTDVSHLRDLEERLGRQEQYLAAVVTDSADAILTLDSRGTITSWNRGAEKIFGYAAAEILGRPLTILLPPDRSVREELELMHEALAREGAARSSETERVTRDGRRIVVSVTRSVIRDSSGQVVGSAAIVRDITEQKTAQVRFAHAERLAAMGTMAAGLAHEVGNPLAAISSVVQLLERRLADEGERAKLKLISEQVSRIARIVREMSDYARPPQAQHGPVQVHDLLQTAITLGRYSRPRSRVTVCFERDPTFPLITGVGDELLQVFLNLILNAYDAMDCEGTLSVTTRALPSQVEVSIRDTGPGVPEEFRGRIFEPFFTTKGGRGTGMGLTVSRLLIENTGGTLRVESPPGEGATFTVVLPRPGSASTGSTS